MSQIVSCIDQHRAEQGSSRSATPSEAGVPIAVSTWYATLPRPASAAAVSDAAVDEQIRQVHADNYTVYGYRKM